MSEFSGWMDMAIKFWLGVIAFFLVLALVTWASWHFFGWHGPAAIIVLWVLVSFIADRRGW